MIKTVGDLIQQLQEYPNDMPIFGDCGRSCSSYPMGIQVQEDLVDLKKFEWKNTDKIDERNCVIVRVDN
jgi:hypothetical protein